MGFSSGIGSICWSGNWIPTGIKLSILIPMGTYWFQLMNWFHLNPVGNCNWSELEFRSVYPTGFELECSVQLIPVGQLDQHISIPVADFQLASWKSATGIEICWTSWPTGIIGLNIPVQTSRINGTSSKSATGIEMCLVQLANWCWLERKFQLKIGNASGTS